ncbi:DUF2264 domain-containing protein [Streptomyces acidiscabies]|uniref:DUF2264 domain-containing protein n=1 Tax=Streptomyces acidiscabies TaxID=42234 RepID=A0AAP6EFK2_9ACTN|nr:DUF2264 domain-containing protein [Streptomyces acidiscabies]MBP5936110.1 DUF2264 domain-containing protein [Streptomyces sp. LBUM 1476]MBZ3915958.1 DUF2264 domain-containing protein [Streptomyces acidiscabies]MDX2960350.1 DUF2264 domain-containing protein [Streptomyces acidiscabies]MDX3023774.1 DUF2264 domain-containing protein [Streptomyces acidiscabies]MDX3793979.1 DUF2264 domain-containing protein [Streptomyces acidiscabies]
MHLPPPDPALSPATGYTRAHWERAADTLLAATEPYATPDRALYHFPGDRQSWSGRLSDGLEGYARTLLLAAFRRDETALERYADGLAAGTAGVWPKIEHRSQPLVEAASIALALRLTRPLLWDRLDDAVQQRAAAWLTDGLTAEPWPCNWELFPVTVGGFLESIGHEPEASRRAVDHGLERIEQWYVADGWYTDGDGRKFDYYNGWAMHLYPVLHAWLADDEKLLDLYGGRLERHLADYARLFGADGAPLHQGRSLTYRFATTAPLWLGALTGRTPLEPGETRRLASGALKYFLDRDAVSPEGLLTLGWHGPNSDVLQGYSGPASPYWASKGFLGLLLPPEHEVWTATESPSPSEREDALTPLPAPNWLLQSTSSDGIVRIHNHGSEDTRYDPYYTRLAYSTITTPAPAPDNSVLIGDDPTRTDITPLGTGPDWIASHHTTSTDARVTSITLAQGAVEVRAFLVSDAPEGTPVRITGWSASEGTRSELVQVKGDLTGPDPTLFVALARLTGEAEPGELGEAVDVETVGEGELVVRWAGGGSVNVRIGVGEVAVSR